MSKTIKVRLSTESLNSAISEIRAYQSEIKRKAGSLVRSLVSDGVEIAQMKIVQMDAVRLGDLLDSISGMYDPATGIGIIRAGAWYACYVEYGTGVIGAGAPHPSPAAGWKYDLNQHGEQGWWYWSDSDANWHWTKGIPSRPFMYETALELREKIHTLGKQVTIY